MARHHAALVVRLRVRGLAPHHDDGLVAIQPHGRDRRSRGQLRTFGDFALDRRQQRLADGPHAHLRAGRHHRANFGDVAAHKSGIHAGVLLPDGVAGGVDGRARGLPRRRPEFHVANPCAALPVDIQADPYAFGIRRHFAADLILAPLLVHDGTVGHVVHEPRLEIRPRHMEQHLRMGGGRLAFQLDPGSQTHRLAAKRPRVEALH